MGESSNGALQDVLSASATKLCHPTETYVAPDVDDVIVCTCHYTSVGYPEPVGGCDGSAQ